MKSKHKRPYTAPVIRLSSGFRLIIGNKVITGMGPAAKISLVKAHLAANKRRA